MTETFLTRKYLRPEPVSLTVVIEGDRIAGGEGVQTQYEEELSGFVWGDDFTLTIDGDSYALAYDIMDDDYTATPMPAEGEYSGETLSQDGNDWTVDVSVVPPP